jgi:hypothetical protein
MDNRLTTNGAANTEDETKNALVTRPHSRRTLITGAAMGLAGAAIGAAAIASPAGATTDRLGNSPRPNRKQKTDEISFSTHRPSRSMVP